MMKKLRVGIVGFGFIGPQHMEAIRRLGYAEVTALAVTCADRARDLAGQHFVEKGYGDWRELVADPDIDVVDITTPTAFHAPIAIAAARAGKHVIVDKPMCLTSMEAREMLEAAESAGVVHAVTFNIAYNIMVRQAQAMVRAGKIGAIHFVRGHYLQEWLLRETDYNWRLDPELAGNLAMVADAGAHWYDMAQRVTGLRIERVLADLAQFTRTRQRPDGAGGTEPVRVDIPDLGMVLCEFNNGARGLFCTGAMHAGHKNDLTFELSGSEASLRWRQEAPNELWIGRRESPSEVLLKDPPLLEPEVRAEARLPGGHNEAWTDAFRNLMHHILFFIRDGRDPAGSPEPEFPTFRTGLDVACIVDAITESAAAGGVWKPVNRP